MFYFETEHDSLGKSLCKHFFKMPPTIPSRAVSAPYLASIWALASFLAALAALARTLRLRDAKSLCLRALGFAPALFLPALCLAFDVH